MNNTALEPSEKVSEVADLEKVLAEDRAETEDELKCLAMKTFSNELICKIFGCYLNTSDLKCCRLVNRKFNRMVMNGTDFRNRVVLKVRKEHLKPDEFGKTKENWKKISLKFPALRASNPSNYMWLLPFLKQVNHLSLRLQEKKFGCKIDVHPLFGRLLSACKKLKSLALEPDFIRMGSGGIFEGNKTLQNLEQLEILQPNYIWGHFKGPFTDSDIQREHLMGERFCEVLKSVKVYKSYFVEAKRKSDDFEHPDYHFIENSTELYILHHLCDRVVAKNRKHLVSHPFYDTCQMLSDEELMLNVNHHHNHSYHQTPALRCLQADVSQLKAKVTNVFCVNWKFLDYLTSRPHLEQLENSYPPPPTTRQRIFCGTKSRMPFTDMLQLSRSSSYKPLMCFEILTGI